MNENDLRKCIEVLGLQPNPTLEQVREAYKDLIKVWHPDRFTHDSKLQAKTQEKVKQINLAYQRLKEHYKTASPPRTKVHYGEPPRNWSSSGEATTRKYQASGMRFEPVESRTHIMRFAFIVVGTILFFSILVTVKSLLDPPNESTPEPAPNQTLSTPAAETPEPPELSETRRQFALNLPIPRERKNAKFTAEGINNSVLVLTDDELVASDCWDVETMIAKEARSIRFVTLTCRNGRSGAFWSIPLPPSRSPVN